MPKRRDGLVAVVAGASRGAGRGIALALGDAGATVYVAGRSTRGGFRPRDGAPGTVEETAEAVTARGGRGIPAPTDCTDEGAVAALFARVEADHGRLDVLANAVWGGSDPYDSNAAAMADWGRPFWELPSALWAGTMRGGLYAYWTASVHAARIMVKHGGGLIASVTDGVMPGAGPNDYHGQLLWDLAHTSINRMMLGMAVEGKKRKLAVVTLMPGFMRTERVVRALDTEAKKRAFKFDRSESTEYVGRAVVALARDPKVMSKSGQIHFVADLAAEYGFTDVDGKLVPRFDPFG